MLRWIFETSPPHQGWPLGLVLIFSIGCGNKQLEDLAAKAKQQVNDVQKSVQQMPSAVAAVTAGEIKLTLDGPVNSSTCSARFTPPKDGRNGLFQIGTSVATGPQSFPAVYLHAPTDASSLQALVGKTVYGELFIAKSESQGHYQSAGDKPLAVQIVKVENNVVTCQLQNAEVTGLDQPQTLPVSGTLVGAVRP